MFLDISLALRRYPPDIRRPVFTGIDIRRDIRRYPPDLRHACFLLAGIRRISAAAVPGQVSLFLLCVVSFAGSTLTPLAAASGTPGWQKPSLISAVIYFDIRRISAGYTPETGSKP